jgi:Flp pilus assembly protein TadD
VRLNPKMASAQNNLANVLYTRRDFNGAIQHYRAALELEPAKEKMSEQDRYNIASTHMNLGSVLDDAGKSDEAIVEYREAIHLQPKNASAHYNLSIVYQKKKDMPSAIAELRIAAKLSPDWPTPHIMLTNLLKDSDPKSALDECMLADGMTHDAKLNDECMELQRKAR